MEMMQTKSGVGCSGTKQEDGPRVLQALPVTC